MMAQLIDRRQLKAQMKEMLRCAQVSPRGMTCLYLALTLVLNLADSFLSALGTGLMGTFVSILTGLMGMVLTCGYVLYCMAIRRGERAEYLTLFDGFSFVGKVILLNIVISLFTFLWGMLFVIPGIVAGYRYRFALYDLYENPGIGVMEALEMSKQQTLGYKGQLFMLDLSYLGWHLLGSVAGFVQLAYIYSVIFQNLSVYIADPALVYSIYLPMPVGLQILIGSVWPLLVALFYLPVYQCTELGYFDGGDGTDTVLADIRRLRQIVVGQAGDLPYFMMGHSMGSFFTRAYIAAHGAELAGAVIMGTGFQPAALTGFGRCAAALAAAFGGWKRRSRFIDRLAFGSYNKKFGGRTPYDWLSADEGNVDRYIADGLCGVTFTCGGFYTLFSIVGRACRGATVKQTPRRLPLLLVSGGDDPVGGYSSGVKKLYDKYVSAGISDVNMIIYRGARHEILNDFCAPQVREDIADFLMRVCAKEN